MTSASRPAVECSLSRRLRSIDRLPPAGPGALGLGGPLPPCGRLRPHPYLRAEFWSAILVLSLFISADVDVAYDAGLLVLCEVHLSP